MKQRHILYYLTFSLLLSLSAGAQTSPKIKELERQRKNALKEIEVTTRLLSEVKRTTSNALHWIQLLNGQIDARLRYISLLKNEISALDENLKTVEQNIRSLEKELSFKKQKYASSLRKMQNNRKMQDKILFILSADNFSQSYRRIRYLKEYAQWQKIQAKEIISKQQELQRQKDVLKAGRKTKSQLLAEEEKQRSVLQKEEKVKEAEVTGLKKKEKTLQTDLAQKRRQAEALNRQIEKAIAEEIRRAEAERKAAEEKAKTKGRPADPADRRIAETAGGYAMTREERSLSVDFSGNKGKLPFPLKGSYRIVSRFGIQKHQEIKNITINNNGIDIQTTPGNDACAVFAGVVTSVFIVPGYNNSVIVRHGNYLTVYSNLKEVYVKSGSRVSTGQAIGKIFTDEEDGNSTILHFELWKEQTKLNPEGWLD
jgi:septal ring factor EnvC (AmiA/AmiB activator)